MRLLGERYGVDLPITNTVYDVIYQKKEPLSALLELFERKTVTEFLL